MKPLDPPWKRAWPRYLCAFVGSLTVLGVIVFRQLPEYMYFVTDPAIQALLYIGTASYVLAAVWFTWLVCCRDFGYGPVRLFLSGIILPGTVVFLLVLILERMA